MGHRSFVSLDIPHEILTTRVFDAPRELVWRAFTGSGVEQWWGPVGFTTTTIERDVRTGGVWRHTMHGPDGTDYPNRIDYTRVEAPELIEWKHGDDSGAEPQFHCSVRFEDLGGNRTRLTLKHIFPNGAARDEKVRLYGAVQGAIDTTDRLARHLVTLPGERDFVLSREFDAPREWVWRAWTDPQRLAHWWGPRIFRNTVCESDLRVGGRWAVTMTGPYPGPGDTDYPVEGEYLEIVEPERLVMTSDCSKHPPAWHDMLKPDRSAEETNPAGTMVQTVTFEEAGANRTRLTIRTRMVSAEILAAMVKMGMTEGWSESLDRLGEELARP